MIQFHIIWFNSIGNHVLHINSHIDQASSSETEQCFLSILHKRKQALYLNLELCFRTKVNKLWKFVNNYLNYEQNLLPVLLAPRHLHNLSCSTCKIKNLPKHLDIQGQSPYLKLALGFVKSTMKFWSSTTIYITMWPPTKNLTSPSIQHLWSRIQACQLHQYHKMRHLLKKYGEDRTNTNIDTAIKGHMLQNILPASKTPTFSSIKNLWLRFSIQDAPFRTV